MPDTQHLYREWSKSYAIKHSDNLKLDNPYHGLYLFKASYVKEPRPNMGHLISWEYGRTWKREHGQYIANRFKRATPKVFVPDVYARRKMMERYKQKEVESVGRSRKYENVVKKIDNRK